MRIILITDEHQNHGDKGKNQSPPPEKFYRLIDPDSGIGIFNQNNNDDD